MSKPVIMLISLAALNLKAGTQFREGLDKEAVKDYTEKLKAWKAANTEDAEGKPLAKILPMSEWSKCPLPAITVFDADADGKINADGFHRVKGAGAAGLEEYPAEVRKGTKEDAIMYALQANANHGVRLTDADKANKLKAALKIAALEELSNNSLANKIGVSEFFVRSHRPATASPTVRKAVSKSGKVTSVDTSRIGKKGGKKKDAAKKAAKGAKKGAATGTGSTGTEGQTEEEKALAGALGGDGAATGTTGKTFDADTETAIKRIVKSVDETKVADGAALEASIRSGAIEISARDLKTLAQSKADRLALVYPLVFGEKRMSPAQAFALIEKVPDANMKLGHLFNLASARNGILVERAENVASDPNSGFHIIIIPAKDHTFLRNMALGSIFAVSNANKDAALAAIKEA